MCAVVIQLFFRGPGDLSESRGNSSIQLVVLERYSTYSTNSTMAVCKEPRLVVKYTLNDKIFGAHHWEIY